MGFNKLYPYIFSAFLLFSSCKKEGSVEPEVNHKPVIENILANPREPFTEEEVSLEGIVSDEDEDSLTYDWRCDGNGYFDKVDGKEVLWNSPSYVGEYHITLRVDDGKGGTDSKVIPLDVVSKFDTVLVSDDVYTSKAGEVDINELEVYKSGQPWYHLMEIYLKFDPDFRNNIESVNLKLFSPYHFASYDPLLCYMCNIIEPWNEETINWGNKPDIDLIIDRSFVIPQPIEEGDEFNLDITEMAKRWKDNPSENYGLRITPAEKDIGMDFFSKEGAIYENKINYTPILIVEYKH